MSFDLYRDRKRDAETVRGRTFMIELSNGDMVDFSRLAKEHGTTPTEILQGFICDLIDGTQTRGSDERDLAQRYFDRCCYSLGMPQTFLSWLLQEWRIDEIADLLQSADYAAGDLTYYAENPEDPEGKPEIIANLKQERAEAEREIADLYKEYAEAQERQREPAQEMQEGIEAVKAYLLELETITAGE